MCCCCCCCSDFLGEKMESCIISFLEKRHPGLGLREIVRLLQLVSEKIEEHSHNLKIEEKKDETDFKRNEIEINQDDGKWRPILLTLGLMYKLQQVLDDSWFDTDQVFVKEEEKRDKLINVFGFYWNYLFNISWVLATHEKSAEEHQTKIIESVNSDEIEMVLFHVKDATNLEDQAPDTALIIHHDRQEIVFTICGTKITPAPSMGDIMLDLHCDSVNYLEGAAHEGIAMAAENVLKIFEEDLINTTRMYPGYSLIIIGYSLGAGVSHLVSINLIQNNLLPSTVKLYCIAYGAPPVYRSSNISYSHPNIFNVLHNTDGLPTLSLHNVTKLFLQIRAIDKLKLKRRKILSLLREDLGTTELDATGATKYVCKKDVLKKAEWIDIINSLDTVRETGFDELDLVGGNLFILNRSNKHLSIRHLRGVEESRNLTSSLKLRVNTFNDHMPWGYSSLFKNTNKQDRELEILDSYINNE